MKHLSYLIWILLLGIFIRLSLDAGISGDEYLHLNHSYDVIEYFKTLGKDRAALHTPKTYLKYYGQSYDNAATLISEVFDIDDIFTLRHVMNAFAGWLIVVFTFLTAKKLAGKRAAVIAAILLVVSPRFLGHTFNNLKDIPFALGFIASMFFILKYLEKLKESSKTVRAGLIASIAFTLSIRPAGLLIIIYLWIFLALRIVQLKKYSITKLKEEILPPLYISVTGYFAGLLFWPYALENPLWHPIESTIVMTDYYITIRQLFEGTLYWSDQLPWYYLLKYIFITIPVVVTFGLTLSPVYFAKAFKNKTKVLPLGILLFFTFFPLLFIILKDSNVYGGWRHILFIYPPLVIIAALGYNRVLEMKLSQKLTVIIVFFLMLAEPLIFMIKNHPLEITYFNPLAGGIKSAKGNYEMDYYFHSTRRAAEKLKQYISDHKEDSVIVAGNFNTAWFFRNFPQVKNNIYTPFYYKYAKDWDFNIITAAYMQPYSLTPDVWPPEGTVLTVDVNGIPVCAVLKRQTKKDLEAYSLIEKERYDTAAVLLENVIKHYPENETAFIQLGKCYLKMGKYSEAKNIFENCLEKMPAYEPALYYKAEAEFNAGQTNESIKTLKHLLKENYKYLQAYVKLAEYLKKTEQSDESVNVLKVCLKIKPGYRPAVKMLEESDNKTDNNKQ
ncbi:MAG: tetratricopeptide repeat protein [Chlorobi bacterium]|nr:tetratricopeptide repeat protein [Chlorobiota bacterium]